MPLAFSAVFPVFDEELVLPELYSRTTKVLSDLFGDNYEIIFVDDGSKDRSWQLIQDLREKDSKVKGVKFSRGFGHHIALTAGIDHARGDIVSIMDSDLQDQPEEIPKLLEKMKDGFDVVYGIRTKRQFGFFKTVSSIIYLKLMNPIIDQNFLVDSNIFRVMSRRVVDELVELREHNRYLLGLISYVGFKQTGIEVVHGARYAGTTKYSLIKLVRLGLDLMTSFSYLPLKFAINLGALTACLSLLGAITIVLAKLFGGHTITGWASLMVSIFFIGSVQLMFMGLMGEYVGRIHNQSRGRPLYVVETRVGDLTDH